MSVPNIYRPADDGPLAMCEATSFPCIYPKSHCKSNRAASAAWRQFYGDHLPDGVRCRTVWATPRDDIEIGWWEWSSKPGDGEVECWELYGPEDAER